MTPGRTQRDLRRLWGEENAGFPERQPLSARPAPRILPPPSRPSGVPGPADRPLPGEPTLPLPFLQGAQPPPSSGPSLAPRDSHLGLGLPQCPAPPSPFAHLPPGTRGPAPCPVGAPAPHAPASSPLERRASTPPRPRGSSGEPELSQRTAFGELPCLGIGPSPGAGRRPPTPQ